MNLYENYLNELEKELGIIGISIKEPINEHERILLLNAAFEYNVYLKGIKHEVLTGSLEKLNNKNMIVSLEKLDKKDMIVSLEKPAKKDMIVSLEKLDKKDMIISLEKFDKKDMIISLKKRNKSLNKHNTHKKTSKHNKKNIPKKDLSEMKSYDFSKIPMPEPESNIDLLEEKPELKLIWDEDLPLDEKVVIVLSKLMKGRVK